MILEKLKEILKQSNPSITDELAYQFYQEAKTKFKPSINPNLDKFELTDEAIQESYYHDFDLVQYRKILLQMKNNSFLTNIEFRSAIIDEYKRGIINLDQLLAENSIQSLASLYNTYNSEIDINNLLLLNSEQGISQDGGDDLLQKTTFVHKMFAQKVPKSAIHIFFRNLDNLAKYNKDLIHNYLNLSDENGKSIKDIIPFPLYN